MLCMLQDVKWHDARDTQLSSINLWQQPSNRSETATSPLVQQQHQPQHQQSQVTQGNQLVQQQQQQQQLLMHGEQQQEEDLQHSGMRTLGRPDISVMQQQHNQDEACSCCNTTCHSSHEQELVGIVLNVRGSGWWAALTGGRHWLAIKHIGGQW